MPTGGPESVPWGSRPRDAGGAAEAAGLPIGLAIVGPRFADLPVLRLAAFYEGARKFEMAWPRP